MREPGFVVLDMEYTYERNALAALGRYAAYRFDHELYWQELKVSNGAT
jgi:hypothetical protein